MILQSPIKQLVRKILGDAGEVTLANYCTVKEAARILDLTPTGVYYRIMAGKLPAIRFGKQLFIRRDEVERLRK